VERRATERRVVRRATGREATGEGIEHMSKINKTIK
jgi:hypothetical protein